MKKIHTTSIERACLGKPENENYELSFNIPMENFKLLDKFIEKYFSFDNFLEQLMYIYTAKDELLISPQDENIDFLQLFNCLCTAFSDERVHLSEIKSLMIITRPFKDNSIIKKSREKLVEVYNTKKSQS